MLSALASGNHLYGDAQHAITGNEARTALVQALTAQGLSPADAAKYQAYVDAGAVVVTLGIVGGQAVYRFTVNSTRVSAADRAALASLEQRGGVANGVPGGINAPNKTQLIDDLVAGGTRITPENIVDIRSINGRTVWLETGNSNAGLRHIIDEHGFEFAQRGISEAKIPDVLFTALQRDNVVGYQGRGTGRPIYEFEYGGQTHRLAITVGDNGFVVGANFR